MEVQSLGKVAVIHVSKAGPAFKITYDTICARFLSNRNTHQFDNGKTVQQHDQSVIRRRDIVEQ